MNIKDVTTFNSGNLNNLYSYTIFVENRDSIDSPKETQYSLQNLFQTGVDNIKDSKNIIIGEKIISHSQIRLLNNFNKILDEFGGPEDSMKIDYDGINNLLNSLLEDNQAYQKVWNWLSQYANFYVNPNPEDADSSNLILTQSIKTKIQEVTESILNIIFRNLLQLIRVKHDYRLYGVGSTVFGGKASLFNSQDNISKYSALPPSCWIEYSGNYIVGNSAYGEDISQISSTIKNSTYHIGPHTSYGIASHTHTIVTAIGNIPTSSSDKRLSLGKSGVDSITCVEKQPAYIKEGDISTNYATIWSKAMEAVGCKPDGRFTSGVSKEGTNVSGYYNWSYQWDSKNGKLLPDKNMKSDIFNHYDTILPTYSSYVWQWVNEDTETNISNPTTYISRR